MIKVIHSELKPWPPDPGASRAEIGGYFVDYVGQVPTLAEVEAMFKPPPPDPATTPLTGEDIERLLRGPIPVVGFTRTQIDAAKRARGQPLP